MQLELGELDVARATQQQALTKFESVYGPEHPEVARTLGNLGIVEQHLGELETARATQLRALMMKEAFYGAEHPQVAATLYNIAVVHEQLGEARAGARERPPRGNHLQARSWRPPRAHAEGPRITGAARRGLAARCGIGPATSPVVPAQRSTNVVESPRGRALLVGRD